MNSVISPEEQIRRVARAMLAQFGGDTAIGHQGARPDLRGLITMIESHLEGKLPPIKAADERPVSQAIPLSSAAPGR